MLALGLILSVFGLGFFCWLVFTLAVYALPFFAGLSAGFAAYHSGSGVLGAFAVGIIAGGVTLMIGQLAFATIRAPLVRAGIALLFAVPAAVAGYHATLGLARIGVPSLAWREVFAVFGAIATGGTAWARMALLARPPAARDNGAGWAQSPMPTAARLR